MNPVVNKDMALACHGIFVIAFPTKKRSRFANPYSAIIVEEVNYGKAHPSQERSARRGFMTQDYVEETSNGYWVAGSRVSLDSIVYDFLNGVSPESIAENFSTLTLEQVYGAITFYLAHRGEVDAYLEKGRAEFQAQRLKARERNPLLYKKLEDAARRLQVKP